MNLGKYAKVLNILYTDKMSVARYVEKRNRDGTIGIKKDETFLSDIPCRISFTSSDNPETNREDINPLYLSIKIFCNVEIDIKKGDYIKAERVDNKGETIEVYEGNANEPYKFVTHQEILLVKRGTA